MADHPLVEKRRNRYRALFVILAMTVPTTLYMGMSAWSSSRWIEFAVLVFGVVAVFLFMRRAADG